MNITQVLNSKADIKKLKKFCNCSWYRADYDDVIFIDEKVNGDCIFVVNEQ
jgi:hypothetical protein